MTVAIPQDNSDATSWWVYRGDGIPHSFTLPEPPAWRRFGSQDGGLANGGEYYEPDRGGWSDADLHRARTFIANPEMVELVNAALYLRRPLLITGKPGTGKSTLAYAVAYELDLGRVLTWPVTSRSTLQDTLYRYDALGRLQDVSMQSKAGADIGNYIRLGPLGTALLPTSLPQVLLIDEIDKSSIDLPNDLLHVFETGTYEIPELSRLDIPLVTVLPQFGEQKVPIYHGQVSCAAFPFVILTSNGERELPAPFLRRCVRLDINEPDAEQLASILNVKFPGSDPAVRGRLIDDFLRRRSRGDLATDQLLNAMYLVLQGVTLEARLDTRTALVDAILKSLNLQDVP